ncbi:MAG: gliding motility-associated C-terminal domain-containing protein [Bacteroidetes bacterium]|nr:gliding motility-associated C-terminal domain-containing protein [Bacteroidota bacterium]
MKKFTFITSTFVFLFFWSYSWAQIQAPANNIGSLPEKCGFDAIHVWRMKNDPAYFQNVQQSNAEYYEFLKNPVRPKAVRKIPVVVHVIHTGEAIGHENNISDAQIVSAVNNLTNAFRKIGAPYSTGGGVDCEVEFCLAQRDTSNNPTTGILRQNGSGVTNYAANGITNANRSQVQALSFWDNRKYYNVWVVIKINGSNGGGTQGYAQLASAGAGGYSASDGTVILGNAMGYDPTGSIGYALKSYTRKNGTLIHEVGHAMGLYHTFTGDCPSNNCPPDATTCPSDTDCGTNGDCVSDTPKHRRSTSDCPVNSTPNACQSGSTAIDFVHNFMDYSSEDCSYLFTAGQKTRMDSFMASGKSRNSLTNSNGCDPVNAIDIGINEITSPTPTFCKGTFAPVVKLKNFGSTTITSAEIKYQIDGGTIATYNWTGSLSNNQEESVTLPNVTTTNGAHTFKAFTDKPNNATDGNTTNDSKTVNFSISAAAIPFVQEFESGNPFPPVGWSLDEAPVGYQKWAQYTGAHANGTSTGIAAILFTSSSNLAGNKDMLITEPISLSGSSKAILTFKLYTKNTNPAFGSQYYDTLKVYVSKDCGQTYLPAIYSKGGPTLATAGSSGAIPGNHYPTSAAQYRRDTISLNSYANESVIFKFEHYDYGAQNFLLDDINVMDPCLNRTHPTTISGIATVCQDSMGVAYSIPAVTGATGYVWSVPNGATIASGQNTTNITVNFGSTSGDSVKVYSTHAQCGNSDTIFLKITVTPKPSAAGAIVGDNAGCAGDSKTYSIPAVTNATGYTWTVPSGTSITAGQNTNSITVTVGSTSGNITVTPTNSCGKGTLSTLAVTYNSVGVLSGPISGNSTVCPNTTGENYSITPIAGATSYVWTVPTGATINGTATGSSIVVDFGTQSGAITVKSQNSCGFSNTITLNVTVSSAPSTPDAITGPVEACAGSTKTYAVQTPATGVTYTWTVPTGATISGASDGPSISVVFGTQSGNITVKAVSTCGESPIQTLAVSVIEIPATPGAISCSTTVCENQTGVPISVAAVAGATTYNWTLPAGAVITSGAGTNSIIVDFSTSGGTVSVTAENTCGTSAASTKTVGMETIPATPSAINGNQNVCISNTSENYSTPAIANAGYYNWSVTGAGTFVMNNSSTNVVVNWNGGGGTLEVTASNFCGTSTPRQITINSVSVTSPPDAITGPAEVCSGQTGVVYSIQTPETGATYAWTVPTGATITNGATTSSITVTFGSAGGDITASANAGCGQSTAISKTITLLTIPTVPGAINGPSTVCENESGVVFSVGAVAGATSYNWTLPTGATISSGATTENIVVTFGTSGGTISVTAQNQCGTSAAATKTVTMESIPTTPAAINGPQTVCTSSTSENYSIATISNASSYTWNVTAPGAIIGTNNTENISVNWNGSGGTISVTATNACGTSAPKQLTVTSSSQTTTPDAIVGPSTVCVNQTGVTYSVQTPQTGATYAWTVPSGASITSGGTSSSITVTFGATGGNITVTADAGCGVSPSQSTTVTTTTAPATPGAITSPATVCANESNVNISVPAVAGATSYNWTLPTGASITSGTGSNVIVVTFGTTGGTISVTAENSCGISSASTKSIVVETIPTQPVFTTGNQNVCNTSTSASRTITITSQSLQPDAIVGPSTVCANETGVSYSIQTPQSGATYVWTLPSGATISGPPNGSSILVDFSTTGGNITVTADAGCGVSPSQSKTITVTPLPAAPGAITCSTSVCQGQTMTAQVTNISGMTYDWTAPADWTITGGQGTNSITLTVGATSGNISVTAQTTCGTSTASTQSVVVIPNNETLTITGDDRVCPGADGLTYTASGITGSNYVWTVPAGAVVASGAGTASVVVDFGANGGNVSVSTNNVCGSKSATITVVFEQLITDNTLPNNVDVCEKEPFTINGGAIQPTNNYSITWQKANALAGPYTNDLSSTTESISGTAGLAGTKLYYRRIAVYFGCVDTSNVCTVSTTENPEILTTDMDTVLCSNQQFTVPFINVQNGVIGSWTHDGQGTLLNASTANPTYVLAANDQSSLVTLEFEITPTNGCPSTGQKGQYYLLVKANPVATGSGTEEICPTGFAIGITGFTASTSTISWTHNGQGTLSNSSSLSPTYTSSMNDAGSTVTLTMTVSEPSCPTPLTATASYEIIHRASIFDPSLNVKTGNDTTINEGSIALLLGKGTNVFLYMWSPGATVVDSLKKLTSAKPKKTTTYVLTGYSDIGCIDRDTMVVNVIERQDSTIFIPSLFSPNADGTNDYWVIPSMVNRQGIHVAIYNREGKLVYENLNYQHDWDGTYNGVKLPDASYYYIVKLPDTEEPLKGVVSILQR